jgi:hypothetical protein
MLRFGMLVYDALYAWCRDAVRADAVPGRRMSEEPGAQAPPRAPTRAEAFAFWWKLGWISFGGPAGQIAIMHRELVDGRRWISERRFLHALNYCMLLPGPEATQLASTSAGCCTGPGAASSRACCSCCRRSSC